MSSIIKQLNPTQDTIEKARAYSKWLLMLQEIMSRAKTGNERAFASAQQESFFDLQADAVVGVLDELIKMTEAAHEYVIALNDRNELKQPDDWEWRTDITEAERMTELEKLDAIQTRLLNTHDALVGAFIKDVTR